MGLEIARAWVTVRGDTSELRKDLEGAKSEVEHSLGDILGIIQRGLAGFAGAAFLKKGLGLAADFEQTKISFDTMLGSAVETEMTLKRLTDFAAKTPFEMPEILQAARGLIQFGERGDDLFNSLNLLGNAASATSTSFGMLALIFNQVRGVGKLLTQDFRQMSTRGIISLQDLANHFGVTTEKAQEMLSSGQISFNDLKNIFAGLSAEGGRFAGMMEKQSQSLSGLTSTLSDNLNIIARVIGTKLLPVAKELTATAISLSNAFLGLLDNQAVVWAGGLTFAFVGLKSAIGAAALALKMFGVSFATITKMTGFGVFVAGVGLLIGLLQELDNAAKSEAAAMASRFAESAQAVSNFNAKLEEQRQKNMEGGGSSSMLATINPQVAAAKAAMDTLLGVEEKIQQIREKNAIRAQSISGEGEIIKLGNVSVKQMEDFKAETNKARAEYDGLINQMQAAQNPLSVLKQTMEELPPEAASLRFELGEMIKRESGFEDMFHQALIDLELAKGEIDEIGLKMRGIAPFMSEEEMAMLESLMREAESATKAKQESDRRKEEAKSLKESLRTPFQIFNEDMEKFKQMRSEGLLTGGDFDLLRKRSLETLKAAEGSEADRRLREMEEEQSKGTLLESGQTSFAGLGAKIQDAIFQKGDQAQRDENRNKILEQIHKEQIKTNTIAEKNKDSGAKLTGEA